MDEAEYLHEQSELAKAAMHAALHRLKTQSLHHIDPRPMARSHPVASVAVAVASGFAAGTVIASAPSHHSESAPSPAPESNGKHHSATMKLISTAMEIFSFAWPIISKLMAAQQTQTAESEPDSAIPLPPHTDAPPRSQTDSGPL